MKDKAVKIAIKKAEELDYQINEMNIEVSKPGKIIYVYFSPKQQAMMGGDLTVLIDSESMVINDIIRGQ